MATALKDTPVDAPPPEDAKLAAVPDPHEIDEDAPQLVLFEGQPIHEHRLSFSGNVLIGDPDLIEMLTLGQPVTVVVAGYVSDRGHKLKRGKDASKPGAVSRHTLVVQSIAPSK
jgi:hypothetical protein